MQIKSHNSIQCRAGIVDLLPSNIVKITVFKNHEITMADAEEFILAIKQSNSQVGPLLVDHRTSHTLTPSAINILISTNTINSLALLVNKGLNEMIAKAFQFHKPIYPVQLFYNEQEALEWLKTFVQAIEK